MYIYQECVVIIININTKSKWNNLASNKYTSFVIYSFYLFDCDRTMSSPTKKIEQMQQHAIELSLEAMNLFSSHDDIADYIAKTFKETYSGCWECKVGTTFGRYVYDDLSSVLIWLI